MSKRVEKSRKVLKLLSVIVISIFITLFGMSEIKAYYQKELNVNIPFTTASYSDLTFSLDKASYLSCSNTLNATLTVTNSNDYNVSYTLSFSNNNVTYKVDGANLTTYTVNANSSKNHSIVITGSLSSNIVITISARLPYSKEHTLTMVISNDCSATFLTGQQFNQKLKRLAGNSSATYTTQDSNITSFAKSNTLSITPTNDNIVSTSDSNIPIYAWYDNGTIYYYSEAVNVYLNINSNSMFYQMRALSTADLSNINTSKATNIGSMFYYAGYNATTFNLNLSNWNVSKVTNMISMFSSAGYGATSFTIQGLSSWDVSSVTSMGSMFYSAGRNATTWSIGDLSSWDASSVTSMSSMFSGAGQNATTWNIGDLLNWDTSSVTYMSQMFSKAGQNATTWNIGDLSSWDTSSVTRMDGMFAYAGYSATTWSIGDLLNWDTSKVTNMSNMFREAGYNATTFDISYIENWDVSSVTDMSQMFSYAGKYALTWNVGDLSSWDTSSVTNMYAMFSSAGGNATTWNIGDLSNWDVSSVTNMQSMFQYAGGNATTWNIGDLSNWDVSSVANMDSMFYNAGHNATSFSLNLSNWDTSSVTNMQEMFYEVGDNATTFNLDLSNWDTSNVTNMRSMFQSAGYSATTFNLDLSSWDTSSVTTMYRMFYSAGHSAPELSLDISGFTISSSTSVNGMFTGAPLKKLKTPHSVAVSSITLPVTMYDSSYNGYTSLTSSTPIETWIKVGNMVTFNANGGSVSPSSKIVFYDENTFGTLPTPTRTDYNFDGWYTSASGGTEVTSSTTFNHTNTTIHAHWSLSDADAPTCTWGGWVSSSIGYGTTTTNTITCTDDGSGIPSTYASLTSSAFSVSDASISILSVTSTSVTNGYAYTVTVSGAAVGSGTISLKANQVIDNNNNANVAIASGSLTITKLNSVAPTLTGWSGTYDGNSHTVTVSGGSGGTIKYSTDGTNWSTTQPSAVGSNTANTVVTVYAYVQGDSNHNDSEVVSATITINVPARTYRINFNKNTATSIGATYKECTIPAGDSTPGCTVTTPTITRANYTICGWGNNASAPTTIVGVNTTITLSAANHGTTLYAITGLKADNMAAAITSSDGLYDTSSFSAGEGTKYMYRGANPNNYIYFNCTDELSPSSSTCETWRILSVEQQTSSNTTKVIEIIKTSSTTTSIWGRVNSTDTYYNDSTVQSTANGIYNNLKGSTTTGAKSHVVLASYYDNTLNTTDYYTSASYNNVKTTTAREMTREAQYYVGLPRVSDYLITTTYTSATTAWNKLTGTNLSTNNWLRNTNYDYWFISKNTTAYGRHQAKSNGDVPGNKQYSDSLVVLPVLHLNNNVFLIGSGTASDPFRICPACMTSNTCTVTTSSGWATSKTLTINPSNSAVTYSFNGTSFSSNNQMSVSAANTYTGYIKDNGTGLVSSCYIVIKAKQQWQHDTCSSCKTCWHCTSGVYCNTVSALPSSSCFAGLDNSYANNPSGCETAGSSYGWNFCNNACYSNVFNASNAANCKTCGCNSWNTTDTTWYDSSCGDSTYSNCKNRTSAGQMVYGTG